jgi:hypothetical protein
MGTKGGQLVGISEILDGVRLPKAVKMHLKNHDLWSRWTEVVGPELSRLTYPSEIKGKTLEITVVHQAWAHQLHFLSPSILNKIRALCPSSGIRDLHFRVGEVKPPTPEPEEWVPDTKSPVKLTERMEMTLRAVEDDELRTSIRRAMEASTRRKR